MERIFIHKIQDFYWPFVPKTKQGSLQSQITCSKKYTAAVRNRNKALH